MIGEKENVTKLSFTNRIAVNYYFKKYITQIHVLLLK